MLTPLKTIASVTINSLIIFINNTSLKINARLYPNPPKEPLNKHVCFLPELKKPNLNLWCIYLSYGRVFR